VAHRGREAREQLLLGRRDAGALREQPLQRRHAHVRVQACSDTRQRRGLRASPVLLLQAPRCRSKAGRVARGRTALVSAAKHKMCWPLIQEVQAEQGPEARKAHALQ